MDEKYPSDAQGRRGLAAYLAHAKVSLKAHQQVGCVHHTLHRACRARTGSASACQELLAESAADKNPFEGYAVEVRAGGRMDAAL